MPITITTWNVQNFARTDLSSTRSSTSLSGPCKRWALMS